MGRLNERCNGFRVLHIYDKRHWRIQGGGAFRAAPDKNGPVWPPKTESLFVLEVMTPKAPPPKKVNEIFVECIPKKSSTKFSSSQVFSPKRANKNMWSAGHTFSKRPLPHKPSAESASAFVGC